MNRQDILIEADDLLEKLDQPNLRIYDTTIRFFREEADVTAYEAYRAGHIPGAAFFDHEAFSDSSSKYMYMVPPAADLARQIGHIGIAEDSEVVFYAADLLPCATRAWWLLRYAGHDKVRVLNGGLTAWKEAGGAIEQGERQYEAAQFKGRLRPEMFVNLTDVQAGIGNGNIRTVNTLPLASYQESHIVGSTCLPCMALMDEMATFHPDDVLAARLREETQAERIVTYCGGGIAATVNAVAHLMLGQTNVAVYDGSMSEWVGEGLPTATGKQTG